MRHRRSIRRLDPHSNDRPEPIEILARMNGRTSFRTPRAPGGSTAVPVTQADISHAIGTVKDKLGASMAMAMACQRHVEWARVEELGHPKLVRHLQHQDRGDLIAGPYRFRARIALWDAFHDLIAPAAARPLHVAAKTARMRREEYRWLLNQTMSYLEEAANTAAASAVRYLFALAVVEHPLAGRIRAVSAADGEIIVWTTATADEVSGRNPEGGAIDVLALAEDLLMARGRRPGVLALPRPIDGHRASA